MNRNKKSPTFLRDLKIKSVSVVDQGANQHAHIKLAKRADEEEVQETQEKQVDNDTAFFARIGQAVAKMFHLTAKEGEEVEKEAKTFASIDGARKTFERIYRISDALGDSLRSIVSDEELTDEQKAGMIVETADQAANAIKTDIAGMFNGTMVSKVAEGENSQEGAGDQAAPDGQAEVDHQEQEPANETDTVEKDRQEGEVTEMKFNVDAMTPEERAQFEDFQKRYGVEEDQNDTAAKADNAETEKETGNDGDIYKGINPAVKAEIETLRKFREEAEEREIMAVAKKYTLIGKKPEELAPVLKGLKAAGGTAYDDMIAVLDSALETVEKSGVFGEIGKRGNGGSETDDAWSKIEVAAQEIVKSNSGITYAQAIDKACLDHPDLLEAYEKSRK